MFSNHAVKFPTDVIFILWYNTNLNNTESWISVMYFKEAIQTFNPVRKYTYNNHQQYMHYSYYVSWQ